MALLNISPFMHDKTKLFDNQNDAEAAKKLLRDINQSVSFFYTLIEQSEPHVSDAFTHLSLLESYITELSKITGYDGMIAQENARRYSELREANNKIRMLENQLGNQMSAQAVSSGIQRWTNLFTAWYEAAGFRYAKIETNGYTLIAEFSSEIANKPRRRISDEQSYNQIASHVNFIIHAPDYDVNPERSHSDLLDTQNNKDRLIQLFTTTFPDSRISDFRSMAEYDKYYLRFTVTIPWPAIDNWYNQVNKNTDESEAIHD